VGVGGRDGGEQWEERGGGGVNLLKSDRGSCAVSALSSFSLQCASFPKTHDRIFEGCEERSTSGIMLADEGGQSCAVSDPRSFRFQRVSFPLWLGSLK
jgi:hypothetical protein